MNSGTAEFEKYDAIIGSKFEDTIFFIGKAITIEHPMDPEVIYPIELSIAAFSIRGGVLGCFWTLIDPGKLPRGCAYPAKEMNEETGLPVPGSSVYEEHRRTDIIILKLRAFVTQHVKKVQNCRFHIFAMSKDMFEVGASLQWLFDQAQDLNQVNGTGDAISQYIRKYEVLDCAKLLHYVGKRVNAKVSSYNPNWLRFNIVRLAETYLAATKYNYERGITCNYHCQVAEDKMDKCTKNYVLRRAFLFLEDIVDSLGIELTPYHHISKYAVFHGTEEPWLPRDDSSTSLASSSSN